MSHTRAQFDVVIVGAGPAGIFAALELARADGLSVLLIEKGLAIDRRVCPARKSGRCSNCEPCDVTCGWGGAGAFSDGKLTLSTAVGGWLTDFVPEPELMRLVAYVDAVWRAYGAPEKVHGGQSRKVEEIARQALLHGVKLIVSPVRHMGTENARDVLKRLEDDLVGRVTVLTGGQVERILTQDGRVRGVRCADGTEYEAPAVVVAPGRQGAGWLRQELQRLGLRLHTNAVDIGVRVEVPAVVMEPLTNVLYESKLVYHAPTFDDPVRTFCMNPYGVVSLENYGDVITVNGHSYAGERTQNTNFALLVSTQFTEPFDDPITYGKSIARLANLLGKDILVQRLGDLWRGKRSTRECLNRATVQPTLPATPGDLSFALPYRHLKDITEMLEAVDKLAPGVNARDTLLYGAEVKFYSSRPSLDHGLQTEIEGLYAIGDGAGITRGLMQASVAGVIAARSILATLGASPADEDGGRETITSTTAKKGD